MTCWILIGHTIQRNVGGASRRQAHAAFESRQLRAAAVPSAHHPGHADHPGRRLAGGARRDPPRAQGGRTESRSAQRQTADRNRDEGNAEGKRRHIHRRKVRHGQGAGGADRPAVRHPSRHHGGRDHDQNGDIIKCYEKYLFER